MSDHICERASIGSVVVSPLEPDRDPDLIPELQDMSDSEFIKAAVKYNSERDVFGFSTILSLNYNKKKQLPFLKHIQDYAFAKAQKCLIG